MVLQWVLNLFWKTSSGVGGGNSNEPFWKMREIFSEFVKFPLRFHMIARQEAVNIQTGEAAAHQWHVCLCKPWNERWIAELG